ncbi:hypothetical protein EDC04DRAFT_2913094 [Pisolithus marmoratus]|nr:hypothetical protein EDC04DRAFT_2913094 [Pisolithus marmoratus]
MKDTRQKVGKGNFLAIYSRAHQKALTPETIRAAFWKTGVWPLNPNVVSTEMMAHSYETSSVGHMPLPQASPVHAVSKAIYEYQLEQHTSAAASDPFCASGGESPDTQWHLAANEAAVALASTSASYLVNTTPLTSVNQLPAYQPLPLTPTRKRKHTLLDHEPESELEHTYQEALHQSLAREDQYKASTVEMQSVLVLQTMHCNRIMSQLAAHEEKEKEKKKRKGKLMGDGLPRLLTGEAFYNRVVEFEKAAAAEEKESQAKALGAWKAADKERRQRNKAHNEAYRMELKTWKTERELAWLEKWQPHWSQPKCGKLEAPLSKPTVKSNGDGREGSEADNDEDTDGDSEDEC